MSKKVLTWGLIALLIIVCLVYFNRGPLFSSGLSMTGNVSVVVTDCSAGNCHYVRAGATGNGSGSDWTNAYTSLPSSLVRGHTYFIASGSYGGHSFNDTQSGSQIITIRKATAADHGTSVGWSDSYGTGSANWNGNLAFNTGYYLFDGAVGGGPGGFTSGHGFVITVPAATDGIDTASTISNLDIRHTEITQTGNIEVFPSGAAFYNSGTASNLHFSYDYFHHLSGLPFFLRAGSNSTLEYNYTGDSCWDSVLSENNHCETLVSWGYQGFTIRYNIFADIRSTGGIVNNWNAASNWDIYGNVFYNVNAVPVTGSAGSGMSLSNLKFFNNTLVNGGSQQLQCSGCSGVMIYDNIFDHATAGQMTSFFGSHDYNVMTNFTSVWSCGMDYQTHENGMNNVSPCGPASSVIPVSISFANSTANDFHLTTPVPNWNNGGSVSGAGTNICSLSGVTCDATHTFDYDMFGAKRGSDGVWDRGAVEYGGTTPTPPAGDTTLPSISITTPTSGSTYAASAASLSLAGTASDNVGVTTITWSNSTGGSGSAQGTTNWSIANITLQSGQNVITVTASDAAGNRTTDTLTVTYNVGPANTSPATPSGFQSTNKTSSAIALAWTANSENDLASYNIYQNGALLARVAVPTTAYAATGLSANTTYSYQISAVDTAGLESANSAAIQVTTNPVTPPPGGQTTYFIRAGATGNSSGSDWTNAYSNLANVSWQRGATYYVAGGSYGAYTFAAAASGSSLITLKKATAADHGTDTGWSSTYGTSVATMGPLTFSAPYYVVNGQSRNESNWQTGYGLKIVGVASGDKALKLNSGANNITIKYAEVTNPGAGTSGSVSTANDGVYAISGTQNLLLSHDSFHDFSRVPILTGGLSGVTVEYSYVARDSSNSTVHAEGMADEGSSNVSIHHNIWEDMNGTGFIVELERGSTNSTASNWDIYGNIFRYTPTFHDGVGRGAVTVINGQIAKNWKFYNNTIDNINGGYCSGFELQEAGSSSSGLENYNNLWINSDDAESNCVNTPTVKATVGYNYYFNTLHDNEPSVQVGTGNPVVNAGAGNYALVAATQAGKTLASPYNADMSGVTRGADGNWDRGAMEFTGSGPVPPPTDNVPPSISITTPTSGSTYAASAASLSLAGTASDNVGVTSVTWSNNVGGSGTAQGTTNWSTNVTLQSGQNVITVTASDAAGNRTTDTLTVTYNPAPVPDTQAPVIQINTPVLTLNTSFWSRLFSSMANALLSLASRPTYTTSRAVIDLSGSASDNVGVTRVAWSNSVGGSGTALGTTNWSVSGIQLQPGVNTITVQGYDAAGNIGSDSINVTYSPAPAPDTQAPSVPTGLTATANDNNVNLSWTASTDNVGVAGYDIFRNGAKVNSSVKNSYLDANLDHSQTYTYNVLAYDAAGNRSAQSDPISVSTSPIVVVNPTGAIAAYTFENSGTKVTDVSGNGRDAALHGPVRVTGKYGHALQFNCQNDYVDIGPANTFDSLAEGTIVAWVKPTSATNGFRAWFGADSGQCHYPFELAVNNGKFEVWAGNNGQCNSAFDAYAAISNPTAWHHLAYVVSASGNKLYIDGVEQKVTYARGSASTHFFFKDASSGNTRYNIGRTIDDSSETWNGLIDNLRIYSRALSADEIQADMVMPN